MLKGQQISPEHKKILSIKNRGEGNGRAKLKEEQVKEIRRLLLTTNLTQKEIGEMFNISRNMVGHIFSRRYWKHID